MCSASKFNVMMKQPFPPVRRYILLTTLTAVLILLAFLILLSLPIASFDPQAAYHYRLNYLICAPLLTAALMGLTYRYLTPVAQLGRLLRQEKMPPLEMVRQARQVAFNAPTYLFITLLGMTVLMTLPSDIIGLLFVPDYEFIAHLTESLLIIAIATGIALLLTFIARRQLQPVLVTCAHLLSPDDDSLHQRLLSLQAISSRISATFDLDQLLDELVQSVRETLGYYNALIFLADERQEEFFLAASGRPTFPELRDHRFKIGPEGPLGHVASVCAPLLIPDVHQREGHIASSPEVRSQMHIPMLVGGRLVGIFSVESDRADAFEERDLQLMTALSNQAAAAIEAIRLIQESRANTIGLERRAHNLMLINRISTTLNSSLDAYEILHMTVQHLVELSNEDYGSVLILERDGQHGRIIAEHPTPQFADLRLSLPPLPQRILEMGIPYAVEDTASFPLLESLRKHNPSLEFHSLLLVPLVARREMIGILLLGSLNQPRAYSDEEMELCQTVASQAAVAVANARLLQDIQQQRLALTRKSQELAEESSKLDAILNNIADGLVVTDPAGRIILSNPAFREMAGLPSARSLYRRLLAESFPVAGLQPLTTQALEAPGQIFTENLELPDGRVLKTSATALRIPPPILEPERQDQIAGVVTILRDITHEVEVDRMKTDFISAVSHELRSPLTAVLGFASLIQRDFRRWILPHINTDEKARRVAERIIENLGIIENESQRLTRLINDVLDIAKIEAGRMEWHMDRTDLAEVIQSAVIATATLAEEKNLPIQVRLPPNGLPPIWGHKDRLIQVVTNLLSNAVKFTEQGQIEVRGWKLSVQGETVHGSGPSPYTSASEIKDAVASLHLPEGEWVVVSVTDTGIGIQAEEIPRLFDKFTQVGDTLTGKPRGTGLGLSICKGIIEHHKGCIWVDSKWGQGSIFSFAVPVEPSPAPEPTDR